MAFTDLTETATTGLALELRARLHPLALRLADHGAFREAIRIVDKERPGVTRAPKAPDYRTIKGGHDNRFPSTASPRQ